MMRWWNNEAYMKKKAEAEPQEEIADDNDEPSEKVTYLDEGIYDKVVRSWVFRVRAEVAHGEVVCVTGNCDSLGNWKHDKVLVLTKEKDDETDEEG